MIFSELVYQSFKIPALTLYNLLCIAAKLWRIKRYSIIMTYLRNYISPK